jgi:hypothetical protein
MIDYIRKFDIELEREHYYAGEVLRGSVVIENTENIRVRGEQRFPSAWCFDDVLACAYTDLYPGVRVFLRGKAHTEWKITRGGERRTVKEDVYFIDEKALVWGKGTPTKHASGLRINFKVLLSQISMMKAPFPSCPAATTTSPSSSNSQNAPFPALSRAESAPSGTTFEY